MWLTGLEQALCRQERWSACGLLGNAQSDPQALLVAPNPLNQSEQRLPFEPVQGGAGQMLTAFLKTSEGSPQGRCVCTARLRTTLTASL